MCVSLMRLRQVAALAPLFAVTPAKSDLPTPQILPPKYFEANLLPIFRFTPLVGAMKGLYIGETGS